MTNILAFDTATDYLDCILQAGKLRFESFHRLGLKHSEHLLPEIEHLLGKAGIRPADLDLIICTRGPGSFTGLRIGMASAKGLSRGTGAPLVSVSTLDVYARSIPLQAGTAVVSAVDARKKRYYAALYTPAEPKGEALDISAAELAQLVKPFEQVILTGPDAQKLLGEMGGDDGRITADPGADRSWGPALLELGLEEYALRGADSDGQGPVYLRRSEAEISAESLRR